jgi:serine/threonine protein kinase
LQHPGIPAVYELGELPDGRPFLAMKLVKGRTLHELLKERSEPSQERGRFLAIFEQVCHAVGYAHAHNVIHRDLKPSNVMVGAHGEVQVMDWGLAKVLDPSRPQEPVDKSEELPATVASVTAIETPERGEAATRTGSVLGTPAYMPPEQAAGEIRKLDARSDVFGPGAILCEILTGRPPYEGKDGQERRQQAERNLAYAKKGNELLGSVFAGLDPKAEYATVADFRNVLKANLGKVVQELEGETIGDALTVAELQNTLGASLLGLGEYEQAIVLFQPGRGVGDTPSMFHGLFTLREAQKGGREGWQVDRSILDRRTLIFKRDHGRRAGKHGPRNSAPTTRTHL